MYYHPFHQTSPLLAASWASGKLARSMQLPAYLPASDPEAMSGAEFHSGRIASHAGSHYHRLRRMMQGSLAWNADQNRIPAGVDVASAFAPLRNMSSWFGSGPPPSYQVSQSAAHAMQTTRASIPQVHTTRQDAVFAPARFNTTSAHGDARIKGVDQVFANHIGKGFAY